MIYFVSFGDSIPRARETKQNKHMRPSQTKTKSNEKATAQ